MCDYDDIFVDFDESDSDCYDNASDIDYDGSFDLDDEMSDSYDTIEEVSTEDFDFDENVLEDEGYNDNGISSDIAYDDPFDIDEDILDNNSYEVSENEIAENNEGDITIDIDDLNDSSLEESEEDNTDTNDVENSAYNNLYEYMTSQNYRLQDEAAYTSDPEWQELNNAYLTALGDSPVEYNNDIDNRESEYIVDMRNQLTQVYGIPEDSPELETIMENERSGYEELNEDITDVDETENVETDDLSFDNIDDTDNLNDDDIESQDGLTYNSDTNWQELETAFLGESEQLYTDDSESINTQGNESSDDIQNQPSQVYGIPEGSPDLEAIVENERSGHEELNEEVLDIDEAENIEMDDLSFDNIDDTDNLNGDDIENSDDSIYNSNTYWQEFENTFLGESEQPYTDDIESVNTQGTEISGYEELNENTSAGNAETNESDDMPYFEINDNGEKENIENTYNLEEHEIFELTDEQIEAVYNGEKEYNFDDKDINMDSECLFGELENFSAENWENISIDEQKNAMNDLAQYITEVLELKNPPKLVFYNNPQNGDYGGFSAENNTLSINEYMMFQNDEAADTVAHELWHAYQRQRASAPKNARDLQYQMGFDNYIRPEDDMEMYSNQLVEAEARAFAQQIKDKISGKIRR